MILLAVEANGLQQHTSHSKQHTANSTLTDISSLCIRRLSVFRVCFSSGAFLDSNSDQIDSLSSPVFPRCTGTRYHVSYMTESRGPRGAEQNGAATVYNWRIHTGYLVL